MTAAPRGTRIGHGWGTPPRGHGWPESLIGPRVPLAGFRLADLEQVPGRVTGEAAHLPWRLHRRGEKPGAARPQRRIGGPGCNVLSGPGAVQQDRRGVRRPCTIRAGSGEEPIPALRRGVSRGRRGTAVHSVYARGAGPRGISLQPWSAAVTLGRPGVLTERS